VESLLGEWKMLALFWLTLACWTFTSFFNQWAAVRGMPHILETTLEFIFEWSMISVGSWFAFHNG